MIFGSISIDGKKIHTHHDSHRLDGVTTLSARRPFLGAGVLMAVALSGFAIAFADLLHASESLALFGASATIVAVSLCLGHLQLLSRDLRGSELGTAIWGSYRHLNRLRREIAAGIPDQSQLV